MKKIIWWISIVLIGIGGTASGVMGQTVHVYSARIEKMIKPAFDAFTRKTGIEVKYLTADEAELIERLKAEGKQTSADVLLTVDAGNLWLAKKEGVLQSVESWTIFSQIPPHLRDPEGFWFGLTLRARTIVYSKERVNPSLLSTYEDLGNPRWKNKLCLRTSKKVYNKSMVATMIKSKGEDFARQTVEGWMANQPVIHAKDSDVLKAIAAGQCDVGLVNTYYLGNELLANPEFPVGLFWANQQTTGTHVNISGAGITKYAKNRADAIKLIEFLSSAEAQNLFADDNLEYPANQNVSASPRLSQWWGSQFRQDSVNISAAGEYQAQAVQLMTRAGYK
ncbi:MAG: extracellular solute-binding protein [SAR324 cluster bacterium]|nr:extracellular solute-binding protein [SAR324 cluster bacterium]